MTTNYTVQKWLREEEISHLPYAEYWNDEEQEREKEFYVLDDDFSILESYIHRMGWIEDLQICRRIANRKLRKINCLDGIGMDLACGNLWAVPHLMSMGHIKRLYCLEYSHHRLLKLGPNLLQHYKIPENQIVLVLGNFYHLKLADHTLDFIFMCQAFHHANNPDKLLSEVHRVLKKDGTVIIIGEHRLRKNKRKLKRYLKILIGHAVPIALQKKLFRNAISPERIRQNLHKKLDPDPILGDHYYCDHDYDMLFKRHGFQYKKVSRCKKTSVCFVLTKR